MAATVMSVLAILVTVLGAILFALVFLFVVRGDKLPAADNNPHRIKYGGVEVSTDRVVMLAIVFALMMAVPLIGGLWLQERDQTRRHDANLASCKQDVKDLNAQVERLASTPLKISATVSSRLGRPLSATEAYLVRLRPSEPEKIECSRKRLVNGEYRCLTRLSPVEDTFELRITSGSDAPVALATISPNEQHVVISLEDAP